MKGKNRSKTGNKKSVAYRTPSRLKVRRDFKFRKR